ncbi:bacillithiol biosynthesis deacetylase BshB1 [Zhaonella formicivorans]|uniref:bacillithiol biosynthesis deacetylase BshB1 n=1 Tax=Zhaonella formicivorans TaxID=2528593 RepID=UPI001D0F889E|nr:bacillithiol biosynthesis deacetylase BshB1 [Zhaonella formicivorans]
MIEQVDLIAFGAHPDDVEIGCGGLIASTLKRKMRVGIVDLTRGEMASTGTVEERAEEAARAAEILGVTWRVNLGIPDRNVQINEVNLQEVVKVIRQGRPKVIVAPFWQDRHPDHVNCSRLVAEAFFSAGLWKFYPELKPYRPKRLFYYYLNHYHAKPSFVVDISPYFELKLRAIQAHHSQFDENRLRTTGLNTGSFLEVLEARNRYFGSLIGVKYGEAFFSKEMLAVSNPLDL